MPNEKSVYIGMGSNMGDRAATLARAITAMNAAGVHILRRSGLYATEPVEGPPQPWFLNCVAEAETTLLPVQLLHALQRIELEFGRRRTTPRVPRTLDLDILLYGSSVIHTPDLEVPHPRLPFRRFVLVPMAELIPNFRHPVLQKSIAELLAETPDTGGVRLWHPANTESE
jgi:2-amino-4-hydroxy-6-hydroxymethyldihydropteridine diphosphokinase